MSTSHGPRKRLPENPSEENLRKQAKRLATQEDLQLAAAQRRLATEYGYHNWAELMRAVSSPFVPLVPLRGLVAFPLEIYPIYIGRPKSVSAIDAVAAGSPILLVAQRDATLGEPSARDMYEVGTLGVIVERQKLPDGTAKIVVEGRKRARVKRFVFDEDFYKAEVEEVPDTERFSLDILISKPDPNDRAQALIRSTNSALAVYVNRKGTMFPELATRMRQIEEDPSILPYVIARHLKIEVAEQQALLECVSQVERLEKTLAYLEAAN